MKGFESDQYYSAEQAATRLSCSVSTVWRKVKSGELRMFRRLGRTLFSAADIQALATPTPAGNDEAVEPRSERAGSPQSSG